MLLDPAKKQLHLPPVPVKFGDGQCRQVGVVGQEDQGLVPLAVDELDVSQLIRVAFCAFVAGQHAALVMDHPLPAVAGMGILSAILGVRLGTHHKVAAKAVKHVQPLIIHIGAVHHVDRTGLRQQRIKNVHVIEPGIGDLNERRDVALQIQQGMQLDAGLGLAERRPRKQRKANVDG